MRKAGTSVCVCWYGNSLKVWTLQKAADDLLIQLCKVMEISAKQCLRRSMLVENIMVVEGKKLPRKLKRNLKLTIGEVIIGTKNCKSLSFCKSISALIKLLYIDKQHSLQFEMSCFKINVNCSSSSHLLSPEPFVFFF